MTAISAPLHSAIAAEPVTPTVCTMVGRKGKTNVAPPMAAHWPDQRMVSCRDQSAGAGPGGVGPPGAATASPGAGG